MTELETKLSQILVEKQSKIIPENIKKDIQIFDITGTYEGNPGDVKLFETEEEMRADSGANEGDLAVIYREEIQNMAADTQTQFITFPETVTLPSAITEFYYCMLRAVDTSIMFDGDIQLTQSSFRFGGFAEAGMIRVQYESEDGINYTRTMFDGDNGDLTNPVDLGTTIQVHMSEEWNDNFGYFMQIEGMVFDGLFEYDSNHISETNFGLLPISGINISEKTYTGKPLGNYNKDDIGKIVQKIKEELELNINSMTLSIGTIDNKLMITFYINSSKTSGSYTDLCYDKTNSRYQIESSLMSSGNLYVYELDTSNSTYKLLYNEIKPGGFYCLNVSGNLDSLFVVATSYSNGTFKVASNSPTYIRTSENGQSSDGILFSGDDIKSILYLNDPKYILAPTQLTTTKDYVYNSIYYGKDRVNEGTLTQAPANTFNDVNAEVYYKLIQAYNNMKPVKVQNGQNFQNAYFISNSKGESLLDLSEVTSTEKMFQNNNYIINCPSLNTDNVSNMSYMFSGCSNLISISELNTNNAIDMTAIFQSCESLINVPSIDTNNVTNMSYMFGHCYSLQSIPQLNTSNVTNMTAMFNYCNKITTIPLLDTSSVTSMDNMFSGCSNLQSIPQLNTSSVTDMSYMFRDCFNLTTIPLLDTSNVTTMINMFNGCTNLTTIPLLDTSKVTNMNSMFLDCINLTTIPLFDTSNVDYMRDIFSNCPNLLNESLNNILQMCSNSQISSSSYKTLKYIGLSEEQAQKCTTLSNYQAFLDAGWTTGY